MRRRLAVGVAVMLVVGAMVIWTPSSGAHPGYTLETIKGRWGFSEESITAGNPGFATGVFKFDGHGRCPVTFAESGGASPSGREWTDPSSCTYTLEKDGRGEISGAIAPVRFVVTQHGNLIRYILCCLQGFTGRGEMNRM